MPASLETELHAIQSSVAALLPLDPSARSRVLAWLGDYFAAEAPAPAAEAAGAPAPEPAAAPAPSSGSQAPLQDDNYYEKEVEDEWDEAEPEPEDVGGPLSTFPRFYDHVSPKTARQKIATAGWWLEEHDGLESWRTFDVTKTLKEAGHPLGYVSGTLNQELRREDPIADVVARSGESAQSHKSFALSQFGRAFIQGRLGE